MATGYEVQMYRDITVAAQALRGIEKSLERIAAALEKPAPEPDDPLAVARAVGVLAGEDETIVPFGRKEPPW